MATMVKVKLRKSWKHGAPSLGKTIVYGGQPYTVDLDDADVKRDYEHYSKLGAFEESSKKEKQTPQKPKPPAPPKQPPAPPKTPDENPSKNDSDAGNNDGDEDESDKSNTDISKALSPKPASNDGSKK